MASEGVSGHSFAKRKAIYRVALAIKRVSPSRSPRPSASSSGANSLYATAKAGRHSRTRRLECSDSHHRPGLRHGSRLAAPDGRVPGPPLHPHPAAGRPAIRQIDRAITVRQGRRHRPEAKSTSVYDAGKTHDSAAGREILFRLRLTHPEIAIAWAKSLLDLSTKTVSRPKGVQGSVILPRRWVVERKLGHDGCTHRETLRD